MAEPTPADDADIRNAMGGRYDPTCSPPASELPQGYLFTREPKMLAQEIAASVMRQLPRNPEIIRLIGRTDFAKSLRDALDKELTAALNATSEARRG